MGVVVSETSSEMPTATLSVIANSRNRRPTMPPISRIGMNTATSEVLIEITVKPISRAPLHRGWRRLHSLFQVARDVFDDHDGVVDDEAGGNRKRHQRKIVEAVAAQIHHAERADERERHGDAGNERGPIVSQKNKDDEDHEDNGDDQRDFNIVNGSANGGGAVDDHVEMDRRIDRACRSRQHGTNAIDGLDHVGARLAEDRPG